MADTPGIPVDLSGTVTGPTGVQGTDPVGFDAAQATLEQAWRELMKRYTVHNIADLKDTGKALAAMRTLRRTH